MSTPSTPGFDPAAEAARLEALWAGDFGDAYVERNDGDFGVRRAFWADILQHARPRSVLEVGCNVGGNLRWIVELAPETRVAGIDVNAGALERLRERLPTVEATLATAKGLPYADGEFDLVFTMGVLIHQPAETLDGVLDEMVRVAGRWVLSGEYYAPETVEVPYRGQEGALFKRPYGDLLAARSPRLRLDAEGFLGRDQGWDDITWWLFAKEG